MKTKTFITTGFTVIELLVVIAVVGGLSLLLLPALAKTGGDVDRVYCQNSLRQIGLASLLYAKDNGDQLADAWDFGYAWTYFYGPSHITEPGQPTPPAHYEKYFQDYLYPYLGTNINEPVTRPTSATPPPTYKPQRGIFMCPSALRIGGIDSASEDYPFANGQSYGNRGVSYIWNYRPWIYTGSVQSGNLSPAPINNRQISSVPNPSVAVIVFDIPYHEARYMPHGMGMNVLHVDGSVAYARQNPNGDIWPLDGYNRADWWRYHSAYGWQ